MTGRTRTDNNTGLTWRKSSYSGGEQGQCVEIAETPNAIHIRDSKNTGGPSLALAPTHFTAFVQFAASTLPN
ncbi:DUF397 domain-containing protein [Streptomyces rubiginosohelvolus]|uniref:DUF397 domain-containing protein n=1 Tax=Streptomyces rubiginosohelvolus TaxID=67362 RepID=UPI0035D64AC7